jgi:12-hydroxyjasmonoyl-L-amino acid 12-hydroxylase / fatty acid hydroxylase
MMYYRKGTRVTFHPYAMGRSHSIWGSDWMEFKPERWIKDGVFQPKSPYCYTVFQAGPRVCIGKELALVEMRTVVAAIVKQFNVLVHGPHYEPCFVPGLTAAFAGGLPLKLCKRT